MHKILCYTFLGFTLVTSPAITKRIPNEFTCRGLNHLEEFKCGNSTICIGKEYLCDGIQDCPDASDEFYCPNSRIDFWSKEPGVSRIKRQSTCGNDQWRCSDGSCISLDYICDGVDHCVDRGDETNALCRRLLSVKTGGCILPPYPAHGIYKVSKFPDAQPGQDLASFVLTVSCRRGFGVVDPNGGDGSTTQQLTCINGEYQYRSMPKCVRFCKLDPQPSVRYMCHVPGVGFKTCKNYVAPGTSVNPICNKPIYNSIETLRYMKCTSGFWNYVAECPADCGRVTAKSTPLVIDGKNVKRGELPWHAGVYRRNVTSYTQICGGTLIANNVVLSAAHCFWKNKTQLPITDFAVSVGKIYREWDSENDVGAQKSDIKDIKIPTLFKGSVNNFQKDIAVVILTTPFVYMPYIRPVCLYYDTEFENQQLQAGHSGKVAGWGLTSASGPAADILQAIEMPFIPENKCIEDLPETFIENITGDKFCAGHMTGKALCHGDSGGGLAFPDKGLGIHRYYLRGIVSVAPTPDDISLECNDKVYTIFTKISEHQHFIERELAASAITKCPPYAFQCNDGSCEDLGVDCNGIPDCADGSDEAEELCKPGTGQENDPYERPGENTPLVPTTTTKPITARPPKPQEKPDSRRCIVPEVPKYSTYEGSIPNIRQGESFDSLTLTVTCQRGYRILNSERGVVKNSTELVCYRGWWDQEMPECIQYCKLEREPSVEYRCQNTNTTSLVECDEYVNTGTSVSVNCNTNYYYFSEADLPDMKCIDGVWNYIARCKAECGRVIQEKVQLVIGWELAQRGELPWHAGIYSKKTIPFRQFCGGSLISNSVVLTAAHCVWSSYGQVEPASDYAVAVGKIYRQWNNHNEVDAQKSDVKEIKVPSLFRADLTNFQQDIAILVVATPFVYQTYVRPVCLNFDTEFEKRQLVPGNLGKVGGWGFTDAQGTPTNKLKVVKMPYLTEDTCFTSFPPSFISYFTGDKFCAGYTNGTSLCRGDSGGGLAFPNQEFGIDRYYLRGISSTAPVAEDKLCNTHTYNLFTQIKKHEQFIKEYL